MKNPVAVLISDIHFTVATLELASKSLIMAREHAIKLNVPLIIAGDTLDSKAIMRGECVNRLLYILSEKGPATCILVGNHDLLNEKGSDHSLQFLRPFVTVVEEPVVIVKPDLILLPYYNDQEALKLQLASFPSGSTIICHQGLRTAYMGHYTQDKTSLDPETFANFRTISGHYHRAQDIKCGRPRKGGVGLFSYIGTPYTTSFSEAGDGPKGFRVLYDDGSLDLIPTNLRKHVVLEINFEDLHETLLKAHAVISNDDLIWLKVKGKKSELDTVDKVKVGYDLFGRVDYKLELIPTLDDESDNVINADVSDVELLDSIISNISDGEERKIYLKALWRDIINEDS